jgi:hypothetical protein
VNGQLLPFRDDLGPLFNITNSIDQFVYPNDWLKTTSLKKASRTITSYFIIVLFACEKEGECVGVSVSHLHGNYYYGWMDGLRREMRNEWNKSLFVKRTTMKHARQAIIVVVKINACKHCYLIYSKKDP